MIHLKHIYIIKIYCIINYRVSCVIIYITKNMKGLRKLFPLEIFLDVMAHQFECVGCFIVSVIMGSGRENNFQLEIAF